MYDSSSFAMKVLRNNYLHKLCVFSFKNYLLWLSSVLFFSPLLITPLVMVAAWFVTQSSHFFRFTGTLTFEVHRKTMAAPVLSFFPGCGVMCSGSVLPFPLTEVGNTFICHWWNCGFFCQTFVSSSHVVLPLLSVHVQYFGVVIFRLVGILTTMISIVWPLGFLLSSSPFFVTNKNKSKTLFIHRITSFLKNCTL